MDPSLSNSTPMNLLNSTEDSSLCNSTPINLLSARDKLCLEREERSTARLQYRRQGEQERRRSEQTKVRQASLDRRCIHSAESSVASVSIGVEVDRGPSRQLTILKMLHHSSVWQCSCISLLGLAPITFSSRKLKRYTRRYITNLTIVTWGFIVSWGRFRLCVWRERQHQEVYMYRSVPQIHPPFCNLSFSTKRRGGLYAGCDGFSRDYAPPPPLFRYR